MHAYSQRGCLSHFRHDNVTLGNFDLEFGSAFMGKKWEADPSASFARRIGKSSHELGQTSGNSSCPDIWELDNGDVAVIGSDLTTSYEGRLPEGVSVDPGERLVIIPRKTILAAKADIPDA
ncbi:hypothetical protein ACFQS1_18775 [Paractinoplanes rhizophilus]|uniref:Uncharacterized protein n=1 Tax=Paractinoplanes rhizophilus TaxID=1416877 RepID=A0ABW2HS90_9ACTN